MTPNRDGELDLFLTNGHIFPQIDEYPDLRESFKQSNQLLLNVDGRFLDASDQSGRALKAAVH